MNRPVLKRAWLARLSGPLSVGWLAVCTGLNPVGAAETNAIPTAGATAKEAPSLQQVFDLCAALQQQLRATQRALEEARSEARASARTTADTTAERLKLVDQTLLSLRQQFEQQVSVYARTNAELARQLTQSLSAEAALQRALDQSEARLHALDRELAKARSDLQQTLAARLQAEQQSAALAQSNATLGHDLERTRAAGTAQEKAREQSEQRLAVVATELGQVKAACQEEAARRKILEQQAGNLLATNVDLALQLARRIETEATLHAQQERLEQRLEETTNRFVETRSLMQQAQGHLEERAREAENALAGLRTDLGKEQEKSRAVLAAAKHREALGLGVCLVLLLMILGVSWLRIRQVRQEAARELKPALPPGGDGEATASGADVSRTPAAGGAMRAATPSRPGALGESSPAPSADRPAAKVEPAQGASAKQDGGAGAAAGRNTALDGLIRKGLSLLNGGQAEASLACFDEALALDPQNGETLVKRGTALERLQRTEDAISSYERAIGLDESLTMAYLLKGAALIRLNRHEEAAECYRRAVTVQRGATVGPAEAPESEKA